jgi:hypothetical protein
MYVIDPQDNFEDALVQLLQRHLVLKGFVEEDDLLIDIHSAILRCANAEFVNYQRTEQYWPLQNAAGRIKL